MHLAIISKIYCYVRLNVVEDAVPGHMMTEMEERRQELIGQSKWPNFVMDLNADIFYLQHVLI